MAEKQKDAKERIAFLLSQGLSVEEIAEMECVSVAFVKKMSPKAKR